ncbi:MAG: hypothetical protein ACI9IP_001016 [Arcticibacterium sp.]|jgi:hypothetical protein
MKNVLVFLCLGIIICFKSNASFDLKGSGLKSENKLAELTFACSITAGASSTTINENQTTELTYTGCVGEVSWSQGGTAVSEIVSPTTSTTYTATCIGPEGTCTSDVSITVIPCQVTSIASPSTITTGGNSTLSYSGCENGSVTWNNGASGNNVSVSPTSSTTYTATCSPSGGGSACSSDVTVNVATICSIKVRANPNNILMGQSSTLSATGCLGTVFWDNNLGSGKYKIVTPTAGTNYTATCFISPSNTCSQVTSVLVNPLPLRILNIKSKTPFCIGSKSGNLEVFLDRARVAGETSSTLTVIKENKLIGEYTFYGETFKTPDILEAGNYYLIVRNFTSAGTLTSLADKSVDLLNPIAVTFAKSITNAKCFNGYDGSIHLSASGGTGNYQVQLNGISDYINFENGKTHTLNNLPKGTYNISVRDNYSCNAPLQSVFINAPSTPLKIEKISFLLPKGYNTEDGSLTLQLSGGTSPYKKMEWFDDNNISQNNAVDTSIINSFQTEQLDLIPGGVYKVIGKDINSCEVIEFITLNAPSKIQITGIVDSIKCYNDANGSISLNTTGGVLNNTINNYSYAWFITPSGGIEKNLNENGNSISNLPAGKVRVIAKDANGIKEQQTFDLANPKELLLKLENSLANYCPTASKGQLLLKAYGGKSPYSISWADTKAISSFKREELAAGAYEATLTDVNACKTNLKVTVADSSQFFKPVITYTEPSCFGKCDAKLSVSIANGNAPFLYAWSKLNDSLVSNAVLQNVCSSVNTTILTVKDRLGCVITTPKINLTSPVPRPINLPFIKEICPSDPFTLDGSQPWGINYSWLTPTNKSYKTPSIKGDTLGTYELLIEDAIGCFGKTNIDVIQNQSVNNFFVAASKTLVNKEVVLVDLSSPAPTKITWNYPTSASVSGQENFSIKLIFSQTGDFRITQFATIDGCIYPFSKTISILNQLSDDGFPVPTGFVNLNFRILSNPSIDNQLNLIFDDINDQVFNIVIVDIEQNKVIHQEKFNGKYSDIYSYSIPKRPFYSYLISVNNGVETLSKRFIIKR